MRAVILAMWLEHEQWQVVLGGGELARDMDLGFTAAASLELGRNGRLYIASNHRIKYGHVASR